MPVRFLPTASGRADRPVVTAPVVPDLVAPVRAVGSDYARGNDVSRIKTRMAVTGLVIGLTAALVPWVPAMAAPQATLTVSGVITDGRTDKPLGSSRVSMPWPGRGTLVTTTSSSGRYSFSGLAPQTSVVGVALNVRPTVGSGLAESNMLRVQQITSNVTVDYELTRVPDATVSAPMGAEPGALCLGSTAMINSHGFASGRPHLVKIVGPGGSNLIPAGSRYTASSWDPGAGTRIDEWIKTSSTAAPGSYQIFVRRADVTDSYRPYGNRISVRKCISIDGGGPAIAGNQKVGETVKALPGTWVAGTSFSYRWNLDGRAISGATSSTLKITQAMTGKILTVSVTGRKSGYTSFTATSSRVGKVNGGGTAWVTGRAKVGSTLKMNTAGFLPGSTFRYYWTVDGKTIRGAYGKYFKLNRTLVGKKVVGVVQVIKSGQSSMVLHAKPTASVVR